MHKGMLKGGFNFDISCKAAERFRFQWPVGSVIPAHPEDYLHGIIK